MIRTNQIENAKFKNAVRDCRTHLPKSIAGSRNSKNIFASTAKMSELHKDPRGKDGTAEIRAENDF